MNDDASRRGYIELAIAEARGGVSALHGGPFGAVVVREGVVIGRGHNRVTSSHDPTAHAEVVAIRAACRSVGDHALPGAELFASCEPCPMCLAATYWARIERVFFAASSDRAAASGFDDVALYRELRAPASERTLPMQQLPHPDADSPFELWDALEEKVPY
ncbi:MAG: nucleoside deaminase [Myxococcales bacterium]|jgi:tRNA(Arg) A34 adenosine deaminase TadA